MKLLLIRHAESDGNAAQVIQGQQEHPLSAQGCDQAEVLAKFLQIQSWTPTHIYSSPLERAVQTAACCAKQLSVDVPIQSHNHLLEIHNGVLQGLTWAEAQRDYPDLCRDLTRSNAWIPIPGSEYPAQVFERAKQFVEWLREHHQSGDRIWLFSHGGFMQHLLAQLMGCDRLWGISIPPTGLFELELNLQYWSTYTDDRYTGHLFRILRFNQTPQLSPVD